MVRNTLDKPLAGTHLHDPDQDLHGRRAPHRSQVNDRRGRVLERKILASKLALVFEQAAPRIWILLGIAGVFILASMMGLWTLASPLMHKLALAGFALAALAALAMLIRVTWPTRDSAIRRIEQVSGVAHRPASSYEDSVASAANDPQSKALWKAHREQLAKRIDSLKVGTPEPRTDRHDPLAIRALLMLLVLVATIIAGDSAADRISSAFNFGTRTLSATARLDAWITPPAYTSKPPVMLSDGSLTAIDNKQRAAKLHEAPQDTIFTVRMSGIDPKDIALEIQKAGDTKTSRIELKPPVAEPNDATVTDAATPTQTLPPSDIGEMRHVLKSSGTISVMNGTSRVAQFEFVIIPDQLPSISLLKTPVRTRRGALKLEYEMKDDYGVASASVDLKRLPAAALNPARAWARKPVKTGAAPNLVPPPVMLLSIPRTSLQGGKAKSQHDLAQHVWAGMKVRMTLTVKDHAGRLGESESIDMLLPERQFRNPVARAIIEQRRKLMWDPRDRPDVLFALEVLSDEPKGLIKSMTAYLGLRSAYHRLKRSSKPAIIKSVVDQLWNVAVRIEDGNLSEAERRLRDLQDKLAKALKDGASEEEIAKLMKELRQALADYMKQLAENAPKQKFNPEGTGENQFITSKDFERMLRDMENMAKSGNRDAAQQMLSEMRDLLDRLQSGRRANNSQSQQQQRQMMKMMDEFGDLIGKQQQLLDDTFNQQNNPQQGEGKQQGQNQPGQQGQGQQGQRQGQNGQGQRGNKDGSRGQGRNGQRGQGQNGTQPGGNQSGGSQLGTRQGQLRKKLDNLKDQMRQFGLKPPGQLGDAGQSMGRSKRALGRGNLREGTRQERKALDQLRKGAQSMAEQMLSRMARRYGQRRGRGQQSFDPLGRPRNPSGTEAGGTELNSRVEIPDQFRAQRSREILKELRRRLGENKRPTIELDYIERLLKRF